METIQCAVSSEAKEALRAYKKDGGFSRLDDALEDLLLKFEVLMQGSDTVPRGERDE